MSPATKILSVTTPLMSKARQPASQATPQKPRARPAPSSHSTLRSDPSDAHHHVDIECSPVGEFGAPHVSVRVSFQRLDRDSGAKVDSSVALHLGGDLADHTAESADQRGSARSATVTSRPSSRQTEAISEPIKPAPMIRTRPGLAAKAA